MFLVDSLYSDSITVSPAVISTSAVFIEDKADEMLVNYVLLSVVGNVTLKMTYKLPNLKDCLWKGRPLSKTVLMSSGFITSPGLF